MNKFLKIVFAFLLSTLSLHAQHAVHLETGIGWGQSGVPEMQGMAVDNALTWKWFWGGDYGILTKLSKHQHNSTDESKDKNQFQFEGQSIGLGFFIQKPWISGSLPIAVDSSLIAGPSRFRLDRYRLEGKRYSKTHVEKITGQRWEWQIGFPIAWTSVFKVRPYLQLAHQKHNFDGARYVATSEQIEESPSFSLVSGPESQDSISPMLDVDNLIYSFGLTLGVEF